MFDVLEKQRRQRAMKAAAAAGADGLLVTALPDVRWLSGFTGSNAAVALCGGRAVMFTDGRYTTQAREEAGDLRVVVQKGSVAELAVRWLAARGATRVAFDARQTTVAALEAMKKALPAGTAKRGFLMPTDSLVAGLREIKDAEEIERLRRAASLGCQIFEAALPHVVAGVPETEVAFALEYEARRGGAEGMSFETIAAGGRRSALPHGKASAAPLPKRGFLTLDFGVILDGYCSDMTRTVHLGRPTPRAKAVYAAVLEAQETAVAAVRPGITSGEIDAAARSVLKRAGLAKWFTHSTGHGVGLEIHEGPRLAAKVGQVLQPGMVITIEPGIYLPDEFGVRIEDMVLVTDGGGEVLTSAVSKQLMVL